MKIYTSYFANLKKLQESGIVPIGIALYPPKWFKGHFIKQLAPYSYMLSDSITEEKYIRLYKEGVLRHLSASNIKSHIERLAKDCDVALLCYEKPEDFCHRHIVADWLRENTGIEVTEFEVKQIVKKEFMQTSLF